MTETHQRNQPSTLIKASPKFLHPLTGTKFSSWRKVVNRYGNQIPLRNWTRLFLLNGNSFVGSPIRWSESAWYRSRIKKLEPLSPILIFGHWRSGTTNFHNHMLQDPSYADISLLQCLIPSAYQCLNGFSRWVLKKRLPETRPMDAVPTGVDEPMSEDFALCNLTEFTHYHRYFFPASNEEIFRRTILFEDLSEEEIAQWHKTYDWLLRKVTVTSGGKRLVLKNPPNTGRLKHLVKYYPDAKFIHVYRNPYQVIASTIKLMTKFLKMFSFQDYDEATIEENVLKDYARLMQQYFKTEHLLPKENFIQIRHEDVVADGIGTFRRVYDELKLPDWEHAEPRLRKYVDSISDYQTNHYQFDDDFIERVNQHCQFAIDRWGYSVPNSAS